MTTLYRPVLIETAEQAEALPVGTVAKIDYTERGLTVVTVRVRGGWDDDHPQASGPFGHQEAIGWTALVPIETEEELQRTYATPASTFPGLSWPEQHDAWKRRLVTPWEEA